MGAIAKENHMRLSELAAKLAADLEANGDTENVTIGIAVTGNDGKKYRIDAVISPSNELEVLRDSNYVNGMAIIAADHDTLATNRLAGLLH